MMIKRKLTPLQQKLYTTKALRRGIHEYMEDNIGHSLAGSYRLWYEIWRDAFIVPLTDNQVRDVLYTILYRCDITAVERQQIEKTLGLR